MRVIAKLRADSSLSTLLGGAILVVVTICLAVVSQTAFANDNRFFEPNGDPVPLTNNSPNPEHYLNMDSNFNNDNDNGLAEMWHIIRNSPTGWHDQVKLRVFYNNANPNTRFIRINNQAACNINQRGSGHYVRVILNSGSNSTTYNIRSTSDRGQSMICRTNFSRNNKALGERGEDSNVLGANYDLPRGRLARDRDAGKYYVDVTVRLISTPDRQARNASETNVFRLKLRSFGDSIVSIRKSSSEKEFGLVATTARQGYGIKTALPFALPCTEERARDGLLQLYDVDNHVFGDVQFYVIKIHPNGTRQRLPRTDYQTPTHTDRNGDVVSEPSRGFNWDGNRNQWNLTSVDEQETFSVTVNMQPGYRYLQIVRNANNGDRNANENILSMAVPGNTYTPNCNYNITPDRPEVDRTYTEGDRLDVDSVIRSTGAVLGDHDWQTFVVRYTSSQPRVVDISPRDRNANSNPDPCSAVSESNRTICRPMFGDVFPTSSTRTDPYDTSTSGESGDYICFFTRVQKPRRTAADSVWRYSDMVCTRPGKQPKVQIHGHDLRVGGDIDTSITTRNGERYHSWGEYAVMSDGCNIQGRATSGGDGYQGSNHPTGSLLDINVHTLTFANTTTENGVCKGNYDGSIISPFDQYRQGDVERDDTDDIVNIDRSDLTLNAKKVYYYPNATVRIRQNLPYGGNYSSISQIPRIIIIAKNIIVDRSVTQVDPWLIALKKEGEGGRIATCDEVVGLTPQRIKDGDFPDMTTENRILNRQRCNAQIKFNSPVMASEIYLYRTHGSTAREPGKAAEVFNLRADSFLSTFAGGSGVDAVATTDAVTELPPRF